jgi:hypothetical protein
MSFEVSIEMPEAEYHSIRALSASRLKAFMRSPAHLRHMDENPITGDALSFGSAFHRRILEPTRFDAEYVVAPDVDRRTKDGKDRWAQFVAESAGKTVLSYDDHLSITGMADAILRHPTAADLLARRDGTEVSVFWYQKAGWDIVRAKARLDAYVLEDKAVIDLKSCMDASPDGFARAVAKFSYHVQAAWYLRAAEQMQIEVETVVFIAAEKKAPYGVGVYMLDRDAIAEANHRIDSALPKYLACLKQNLWPSYDAGIQTLKLPRWAVVGEEETL